jgi:hypothetical protein
LAIKNESLEDSANLPEPSVLALEVAEELEAALEQFATIAEDLKLQYQHPQRKGRYKSRLKQVSSTRWLSIRSLRELQIAAENVSALLFKSFPIPLCTPELDAQALLRHKEVPCFPRSCFCIPYQFDC